MKEEMSLHEWIYNYIEEAIRFGIFRQGEKLPTISQFAERFQVSGVPSFMPLSSWRNITT